MATKKKKTNLGVDIYATDIEAGGKSAPAPANANNNIGLENYMDVEAGEKQDPAIQKGVSSPQLAVVSQTPSSSMLKNETASDFKDFGLAYQGESFEDWYKANYGGSTYDPNKGFARHEGISDADWNYGNKLYNYYQQEQTLENNNSAVKDLLEKNYAQSIESLDASKKQSQQEASIMYDKLMKYLPDQVRSQGLGGLGASESAMLKAQSQYSNTMKDIESAYSSNRATLDSNRQSSLTDLELAYAEDKTNLDIAKREALQGVYDTSKNEFESKQDSLLNSMKDAILNSDATSAEDIISTINKGDYTEERYNQLVQLAQTQANINLRAQQDEDFAEAMNLLQMSNATTAEEAMNELAAYQGKLKGDDWQTLQAYAQQLAADNFVKVQEENFSKTENIILNSNTTNIQELLQEIDKYPDLNESDKAYLNSLAQQVVSDNVYTEQQNNKNNLVSLISGSTSVDLNELMGIINGYNLSEQDKSYIQNLAQQKVNLNIKSQNEEAFNNALFELENTTITTEEERLKFINAYSNLSDEYKGMLNRISQNLLSAQRAVTSAETLTAIENLVQDKVFKNQDEFKQYLKDNGLWDKLSEEDKKNATIAGEAAIENYQNQEAIRIENEMLDGDGYYKYAIDKSDIDNSGASEEQKAELHDKNKAIITSSIDAEISGITTSTRVAHVESKIEAQREYLTDKQISMLYANLLAQASLIELPHDENGNASISNVNDLEDYDLYLNKLNEYHKAGKLSDSDYTQLKRNAEAEKDEAELLAYTSTRMVGIIGKGLTATIDFSVADTNGYFTGNDRVSITFTLDDPISISDSIARNAKEGQAVIYNGALYVKRSDGKWQKTDGKAGSNKARMYLKGTVYDLG